MTLSLNKLNKILETNGMKIKQIYAMDNFCVYIEITFADIADTFLMYIPSKYEIDAVNYPTYKLTQMNIEEDGTIPTDYSETIDDIEMEKKYPEIDISTNSENEKNIEKHLEENYNCPMKLSDLKKPDIKLIKDIFRQLKRLKLCMQNLKYKLSILYNCYLCCTRRNDTYICYSVENGNKDGKRRVLVSIDLESFYEKNNSSSMLEDVKTIHKGLEFVLDKNQNKYVYNLQKMMEYKTNFELLSTGVIERKNNNRAYLERLENLLSNILIAEKNIIKDIQNTNEKYQNKKALYQDIEKSHIISKKQDELSRIIEVKNDIISNISKAKIENENLYLKVDQICFDNTVMLNTIMNNFTELSSI
jgi:hypothetical protein